MNYRTIPGTDLTLSEVGFGTWTVSTGWWGDFTDEQAVTLLRKAYDDYGITFFDAADTYGNGRSETQLALAFEKDRDKVVIGSKFAYDIYDNPGERTGQRELDQKTTPEYIRFALENSLKRLNTDYLDLYQIHNAKMDHIEDGSIFETLDALKAEGKIREYGVALGPAIGWLAEGVRAIQERHVSSLMIIYSLLEQHPGDAFIEASHRHNKQTGFIARVPHASGMLEGHYTKDTVFEKSDHRSHRPKSWLLNGVQKVEQLRFLEKPNRTLGQAAMKFILAEETMTSILPNIYNEAQLQEFGMVSDCPDLTVEELTQIRDLVATNFGITDEPPMMYKGTMTHPNQQQAPALV